VLRLLAFVLPLGLDSFAVAAAIGAAGPVTAGQRLRISVIFVVFEAGMPLIGLTLGSGLAPRHRRHRRLRGCRRGHRRRSVDAGPR
jgi:putative Mn2+ efflux pump MntP